MMIVDACSFCEPPTWSEVEEEDSPKQPKNTMTPQQMSSIIQTQELKD